MDMGRCGKNMPGIVMSPEKRSVHFIGPAVATAAGVALFAAAIQVTNVFSAAMPFSDFVVYAQTVVLPLAALVATLHLVLFVAFRTTLRERSALSAWRLGMALAVALGTFQCWGVVIGAMNAVLRAPWAMRLIFAGLSTLCGLGAFAVVGTPARQRALAILLVAVLAASISGAAYRVHTGAIRQESASAADLYIAPPSAQAFSDDAIIDYTETAASTKHTIPRVILISMDSLRWDALGCYATNENSPNIDQFAEEAVLFEQAFVPSPWTLPSLASMTTGLAPAVHGATEQTTRIPEDVDTLGERMAEGGYLTCAFLANVFLQEERGFNNGFHRYLNIRTDKPDSTERVTNHAIQWITANAESDFFLWLHYFDPHQPYTPPDEFAPDDPTAEALRQNFPNIFWVRAGNARYGTEEITALRALYDGEVRYVDNRIGRIFETLHALDLYDDALIIITSDHGEEFWEHGGFEHGHSLYDELLRIPLLIRLPHGDMGGRRITARVSLTALFATILELCEVPHDPEALSAGSFAPLMKEMDGEDDAWRFKAGFPMVYEDKECVYFGRYKYIKNLGSHREELYDLETDPAEQINIITKFPDLAERARKHLDEIAAEEDALRARVGIEGEVTVDLTPEARQELQDLGYL